VKDLIRPHISTLTPKTPVTTDRWNTATVIDFAPHANISYECFVEGQGDAILKGQFTFPKNKQETSRLIAVSDVNLGYVVNGPIIPKSKESFLICQYLKNEIESSKPDAVLMFNEIPSNLFRLKKLTHKSAVSGKGDVTVPVDFPLTGSVPFIVNQP
jgi:hypothetical protein